MTKLRAGARSSGRQTSRFRNEQRLSRNSVGNRCANPSFDRFGPSTLVEAGDQKFLIDASRGATTRLFQFDIPIGRTDVQLLTHDHSDRVSCLPDVWLTRWLESHFGDARHPYKEIGPTGARRLIENLEVGEDLMSFEIGDRVTMKRLMP